MSDCPDDATPHGHLPTYEESSDKLANALRSHEYQEERRDWISEVRTKALATGLLGVMVFALLEAVSFPWTSLTEQQPPSSPGSNLVSPLALWLTLREPVRVADSDATVIVTAMVVLVATLNIAVVASAWRPPTIDVNLAHTAMWVDAVMFIITLAGATALLTALMKLPENPALGALLLLVAVLTVFAAAAAHHRGAHWASAGFRQVEAEKAADAAKRALAYLDERWERVDGGTRASRWTGLLVLLLTSSLTATAAYAAMGAVVFGRAPSWSEVAVIGTVYMLPVAFVTVAVCIVQKHRWVRIRSVGKGSRRDDSQGRDRPRNWKPKVVYLIFGFIMLVVFAGWTVTWGLEQESATHGVFYAFGLGPLPVGVALLMLGVGRLRGRGPGVWAAQWTVHGFEREYALATSAASLHGKQIAALQRSMAELQQPPVHGKSEPEEPPSQSRPCRTVASFLRNRAGR